MGSKYRILIMDNDKTVAALIESNLSAEYFEIQKAYNIHSAERMFADSPPDLVIMEILTPEVDGYQICRQIRQVSDVPIIILSSRVDSFYKILALEMGADDYITKPFDVKEVVARIRAVLRRYYASMHSFNPDEKSVSYPDLTINMTNYYVTYMGQKMLLPPKELELLYFLASSPNQVFTREQLLEHIWGYDYAGDTRTVDVHIKRLREKFKDHSSSWSITTVWGIGYKFDTNVS